MMVDGGKADNVPELEGSEKPGDTGPNQSFRLRGTTIPYQGRPRIAGSNRSGSRAELSRRNKRPGQALGLAHFGVGDAGRQYML